MRVPWRDSKGACWARHHTQQMYAGEEFTLQLDSHHRFVEGWDDLLLEMFAQTARPKPILTAYAPSFDPADETAYVQEPWELAFDRFIPEGAVFFRPRTMEGWRQLDRPIPGRFLSAHFLFTVGRFCTEVPYDPEYYFHGEEISLGVRAFTHGYDLFCPHRVVLWHEYTRNYRTKHWDDHVPGKVETTPWHQRNDETHKRNRILFGMEAGDVDFGIHGFGTERSLADYERYAGLSFRLRLAQDYTIRNGLPPNPDVYHTDNEWIAKCVKDFWTRIRVPTALLAPNADCDFWFVGVHDSGGAEIHREDIDAAHVALLLSEARDGVVDFAFRYRAIQPATTWTVWLHSPSRGWLSRITAPLGEVGVAFEPAADVCAADTVLVTCMYNGLWGTPYGGRLNRDRHYRESLATISRMGLPIVCFVPQADVAGHQAYFGHWPHRITFVPLELHEVPRHSEIRRLKTDDPDRYSGQAWQERCVEVMWGKFTMLERALAMAPEPTHVYWIDAGLANANIISTKYISESDLVAYRLSEVQSAFPPSLFSRIREFSGDRILALLSTVPHNPRIPERYNARPYTSPAGVVGGLFGGPRAAVAELCRLFHAKRDVLLRDDVLYFEESILTGIVADHPELFRTFTFDSWYHEGWPRFDPALVNFSNFFDHMLQTPAAKPIVTFPWNP